MLSINSFLNILWIIIIKSSLESPFSFKTISLRWNWGSSLSATCCFCLSAYWLASCSNSLSASWQLSHFYIILTICITYKSLIQFSGIPKRWYAINSGNSISSITLWKWCSSVVLDFIILSIMEMFTIHDNILTQVFISIHSFSPPSRSSLLNKFFI